MTIEIKNRWDGNVIYTAETASDVRTALEEAVKAGANLRGANLPGADLTGANLSGADLTGADLRGAYLYGAALTGDFIGEGIHTCHAGCPCQQGDSAPETECPKCGGRGPGSCTCGPSRPFDPPIPDEAENAAAEALHLSGPYTVQWRSTAPLYQHKLRITATNALTAAAPHIREQERDRIVARIEEEQQHRNPFWTDAERRTYALGLRNAALLAGHSEAEEATAITTQSTEEANDGE